MGCENRTCSIRINRHSKTGLPNIWRRSRDDAMAVLAQSEIEMAEVSVAEAKAHLSEILRRVEVGEILTITRRGRPVVRVVGVPTPGQSWAPKKPIDFEALRVFRESIPMSNRSAAEIVREMRDGST